MLSDLSALRSRLRSLRLYLGVVQRHVRRHHGRGRGARHRGVPFCKIWRRDPGYVCWAMRKARLFSATGWVWKMARWREAASKAETLIMDINYLRSVIEQREWKKQMHLEEQRRGKKMLQLVLRRRLKRTSKLAFPEKELTVQGT